MGILKIKKFSLGFCQMNLINKVFISSVHSVANATYRRRKMKVRKYEVL
jgi:hypothetical protein